MDLKQPTNWSLKSVPKVLFWISVKGKVGQKQKGKKKVYHAILISFAGRDLKNKT